MKELAFSTHPLMKLLNVVQENLLKLLAFYVFIFGVVILFRDPGPEGWGYLAGIMTIVFSTFPFISEVLIRTIIKKKNLQIGVRIILSILIGYYYLKWGFITGHVE